MRHRAADRDLGHQPGTGDAVTVRVPVPADIADEASQRGNPALD